MDDNMMYIYIAGFAVVAAVVTFIIMTIVCAIALACSMLLPNVEEK